MQQLGDPPTEALCVNYFKSERLSDRTLAQASGLAQGRDHLSVLPMGR
jgi:hypothetical protein